MRMLNEEGNPISVTVDDESIAKMNEDVRPEQSRRDCILSKNMIIALVKQVSSELSNHNLYKTFANYYKFKGLAKLQCYFTLRAEEETRHMNWILNYLEYNDAEFIVPEVEEVDVKITDLVFPFKATVDREIQTTIAIYKIMKLARNEEDFGTEAWLLGDSDDRGKLIQEQTEEEHISRLVLRIAQQENDWLTKEDVILSTYQM